MADTTLTTIQFTPPINFNASPDGEILTIANGAIGNANTSYTYFDLVKAGFNIFTLDFTIQATTLTIEATNSLTSVNADAVWRDVTLAITSGADANFTATNFVVVSLPFLWSRFRVKRVTTNAVNALRLLLTRGVMK